MIKGQLSCEERHAKVYDMYIRRRTELELANKEITKLKEELRKEKKTIVNLETALHQYRYSPIYKLHTRIEDVKE